MAEIVYTILLHFQNLWAEYTNTLHFEAMWCRGGGCTQQIHYPEQSILIAELYA